MTRFCNCIVYTGVALQCSLMLQPASAADFFEDLLSKLPRSANVLVMLNADQIFVSDVAIRERWKQHYDSTYADSPLLLPPSPSNLFSQPTSTWPI